MSKPFSQACENNKHYILSVLKAYLKKGDQVLEIGSGTAQHIKFFADSLSEVSWIPSEMPASMPVLLAGLDDPIPENIEHPVELDVEHRNWGKTLSAVFSANTLHIMSADHVEKFFSGAARALGKNGHLLVYGPFNYQGNYSSESNARFDQWLAARDPLSAIRDFEWVNELAQKEGLSLVKDHDMPANNRLVVWQKNGV